MRLDDERESGNIEDQRGSGGGMGFGGGGFGGGGGLIGLLLPLILSRFGIGGVVVLGILYLVFGGLSGGGGQHSSVGFNGAPASTAAPGSFKPGNDTDKFVSKVLATTEDTWSAIFKQQGQTYTDPTLVLFSGQVRSACGLAQSAAGPFYCPGDRKVYLDTSFFDELSSRFGSPGQFAQAYVIAHEIGHHVQNQLGLFDKLKPLQDRATETQANALQVRVELQADCYAGVWAAKNRDILDSGDFEQGVRAAKAIGDDTLQKQARGTVVPDSFTHGTSAQRMAWLTKGFQAGDMSACDTFASGADA